MPEIFYDDYAENVEAPQRSMMDETLMSLNRGLSHEPISLNDLN